MLDCSATVSLKSRFCSCPGQCFRCAEVWPSSNLAERSEKLAARHDPFATVKCLISEMIARVDGRHTRLFRKSLAETLSGMVQALSINSADATKLTALYRILRISRMWTTSSQQRRCTEVTAGPPGDVGGLRSNAEC